MSTAEPRYCYRHPDRETGLSCSECGRPICADCANFGPVGIRCPDHASVRPGATRLKPRPVRRAPGFALATGNAPVTYTLIALNVLIYLIGAVQGGGLSDPGASINQPGSLYRHMVLFGPFVPHEGWYRLVTAMFLHENLLHIAFNMYALFVIGRVVEQYLGTVRYIGLYFVSGLAGSAGALLQTPLTPVLGASGAIFGILGAMMILEWQVTGRLAGQAAALVVINLGLSFVIPGISWGGHVGGLIGGMLVMLAYAHWRGGRAAYGQLGLGGIIGLVAVAVGSVAIAYFRVRGYA
ncbi:MAG TPA: rhomboid family intramembrane serine protease [Gaiellaceae bacterium]|jgi:membrane associated rhomboid family serine protease|nr:rhomboid family intramembrane serine protease [Gaiellaceae bacterium]